MSVCVANSSSLLAVEHPKGLVLQAHPDAPLAQLARGEIQLEDTEPDNAGTPYLHSPSVLRF